MPASVGSAKVANPQACEDLCSATEGCNAASYYLDHSAYNEKNCWLKTIANACEMPADAVANPNAVLLLMLDASCAQLLLPLCRAPCIVLAITQEFHCCTVFALIDVQHFTRHISCQPLLHVTCCHWPTPVP